MSGRGWSASKTVEEKIQYASRQIVPPVESPISAALDTWSVFLSGSLLTGLLQMSCIRDSEHVDKPKSRVSAYGLG